MPKFSAASIAKLETCHRSLHALMMKCIEEVDFTVVCGHRGKAEQEAAFYAGTSKLHWPHGKHNALPSLAVDIAPVKYKNGKAYIDWGDHQAFRDLAAVVMRNAAQMKIAIRWGGDWDGNPRTKNSFNDLPHFELKII